MNYTYLILLISLLFGTLFWTRRDLKAYEAFKKVNDTESRVTFYKKWTIEPLLIMGLGSVLVLLLIGKISAVIQMPEFLKEMAANLDAVDELKEDSFWKGFLGPFTNPISLSLILMAGTTLGAVMRAVAQSKKEKGVSIDFQNIEALLPRNYRERWWGAAVSLVAGVTEELFFRIMIPILIYGVSGSVWAAIILSSIWFGAVHLYQGAFGILATTFMAFLFFALYLMSKNIWLPMIVHTLIDVNALVSGPWLTERLVKRKGEN